MITRRAFVSSTMALGAVSLTKPATAMCGRDVQMLDCGCPGSKACQQEAETNRLWQAALRERKQAQKTEADRIHRELYPSFKYFIVTPTTDSKTIRNRIVPSIDYETVTLEVHVHQLITLNTGRIEGPKPTVSVWSVNGLGMTSDSYVTNQSNFEITFKGDIWGRLKIGSFKNYCAVYYRFKFQAYDRDHGDDGSVGCFPRPRTRAEAEARGCL